MKGLRYAIASGTLGIVNGDFDCPFASGYAGRPRFRNDPSKVDRKSEGPLPPGKYRMRVIPHPRFAGPAVELTPELGNFLFGRSGFWIHGDNPEHDASSGCIVVDRNTRLAIASLIDLGFTTLVVTAQ